MNIRERLLKEYGYDVTGLRYYSLTYKELLVEVKKYPEYKGSRKKKNLISYLILRDWNNKIIKFI